MGYYWHNIIYQNICESTDKALKNVESKINKAGTKLTFNNIPALQFTIRNYTS